MTRRLLEASRAVIVHSRHMACEVRKAGFRGPIVCIPHGAWIPDVDRLAYRQRLGLDETTPLIGVFGHLKPYKRIAESLRAFHRLLRLEPRAKMILGGEPHRPPVADDPWRSSGPPSACWLRPASICRYISACDRAHLRYLTVAKPWNVVARGWRSTGPGSRLAELPDDISKVPVVRAKKTFA
jgi:glycosyltransferase involved in cell wall biosynthesis